MKICKRIPSELKITLRMIRNRVEIGIVKLNQIALPSETQSVKKKENWTIYVSKKLEFIIKW